MKGFAWLVVAAALMVFATDASADQRPFTFTYDTYPEGKGEWEYEQYFTWEHRTDEDKGYSAYRFAHAFEFGLAENFDLEIYVPRWRYEDTDEHTGTQFENVGIQGIFYLLNPVTDPIGLGLYAEVNGGEDELEFEYKLLLQKDVNNWTIAYNLIAETEVEGVFRDEEENEVEGVLEHAFGASYAINRSWRVGGEALIESIFPKWSDYEDTVMWAGPVVSYGAERWWVTVSPMMQVTSVEGEPQVRVRLIAGYEF
jgi:hypothetical protein